MAVIPGGSFWGYRELLLKIVGGRVTLPLWELEGIVPHAMQVFKGDAPDEYAAIQTFSKKSAILLLQVWQNPGIFQLSYDGVEYQDEVEVDPEKNLGSWFHRYEAKGFRVKNKAAGSVAKYQVIPFW